MIFIDLDYLVCDVGAWAIWRGAESAMNERRVTDLKGPRKPFYHQELSELSGLAALRCISNTVSFNFFLFVIQLQSINVSNDFY